MKLTILTADATQSDPSGKVHALGLGWSWTVTPTPPMSVVVFVDPEPDTDHIGVFVVRVQLWSADGNPVQFEGAPMDFVLTANIVDLRARAAAGITLGPGLPLPPGRYFWHAELLGKGVIADTAFNVQQGVEPEVAEKSTDGIEVA
ncbi:hypothetical protein ACQPXH_01765 [Nocardia sp. CA-135953]|uniref:hypothetical protein n=1 Tax=Nocardia sp. CA-135953 TaxID=3239978 RepID=UPI003D980F39